MPFKFNAARRHRIPKARYRVRNWPEYEAGLRRRGDLTLWIDEAALNMWQAPRRNTPGGQATYSDLAIEMVLMVIPPRASAVLSTDSTDQQSQRDRHVRMIAEKGRMGWQKATGYGRRSLVETAIGRYKHLIGSTLRARNLATQQGEVAIAVRALNRMINVGKPLSIRVT